MADSIIRQNYPIDLEAGINKQINMELFASYTYAAMYAYFSGYELAKHGFAKFFRESSDEERDHVYKLIKYQNMRGGRVAFQDVAKPVKINFESPLGAIEDALALEKTINQSLLDLHKMATSQGDPQLPFFLEAKFLKDQVKTAKKLGDMITKIKRAGEGVGLHIIDQELKSQ